MGESGADRDGQEAGGVLKTATAAVGLLAGIVAVVYVIGGLVIALRLLFDHYDFNAVVVVLGQLPPEPVIATALLDVLAPAAAFGLALAIYYGARNRPGRRSGDSDDLDQGAYSLFLRAIFFPLASVALCAWALNEVRKSDGISFWFVVWGLAGIAVTWALLASAWFLKRRVGRQAWPRLVRAVAAGGLFAVVAIAPAAMTASSYRFEPVRVCTTGSQIAERGLLIGEGGGRVLIERQIGEDAGVFMVPTDRVTHSEFGDVTRGPCPSAEGAAPTQQAEVDLGGHGSEAELALAMRLRPQLRFDSGERWRPLEVGRFVEESFADGTGHAICQSPGNCEEERELELLQPEPGASTFIDVHGSEESGSDYRSPAPECVQGKVFDCNEGATTAIYYRRTSFEGSWYWDYWWFYRYNAYTGPLHKCNDLLCGNHEGDWEGVTVVTTPTEDPQITAVLYAAHKNRVLVESSSLPIHSGHPIAYVARGTHATYPYRCEKRCRQYATLKGIENLPEDPHDGTVEWGGNDDAECEQTDCVQPLPEVGEPGDLAPPLAGAWAGWQGRWGVTCREGCRGEVQPSPRSPGLQDRYLCPWAATDWSPRVAGEGGLRTSERAGDASRTFARCSARRGDG